MTAAEARRVVADLRMADAVVDITGRVKLDGVVVAEEAGVHRSGITVEGGCREHRLLPAQHCGRCSKPLAEVRWFETVMEWHARMPA